MRSGPTASHASAHSPRGRACRPLGATPSLEGLTAHSVLGQEVQGKIRPSLERHTDGGQRQERAGSAWQEWGSP